jgi:RHS repeat-associated protein
MILRRSRNAAHRSSGPGQARLPRAGQRALWPLRSGCNCAAPEEITVYVGGLFERIERAAYLPSATVPSGTPTVEYRSYIQAGGTTVAVHAEGTGVTGSPRDEYLHRDHLGSVIAITSATGAVVDRLSFDPWGKRRLAGPEAYASIGPWRSYMIGNVGPGQFLLPESRARLSRGFTGHEMLDDTGVIHMNGRVYDPEAGRFVSADPMVQFPASTQGYDRYGYVGNNPLSYTDPSGFEAETLWPGQAPPMVDWRAFWAAGGFMDPIYGFGRLPPGSSLDGGGGSFNATNKKLQDLRTKTSGATAQGTEAGGSGGTRGPWRPVAGPEATADKVLWENQDAIGDRKSGNDPAPSNTGAFGGTMPRAVASGAPTTGLTSRRTIAQELTEPYTGGQPTKYEVGPTFGCFTSATCSRSIVHDYVELNSMPFTLGAPTEGRHDLLFGTQPIYHSRPSDFISINDALEGHVFTGRVIHATFEDQGAVWIYTRGVGDEAGLSGLANMVVGVGPAFGRMHYNIQQQLNPGGL